MADWSMLKTEEDLLKSNLRVVPSRLMAKKSNKAGASDTFTITGHEFSRRVNPPENLTSQVVLGQYLYLSKGSKEDKTGKNHLLSEVPRMVALARTAGSPPGTPLYSQFSLLAEDEVEELGKSLKTTTTAVVNENEVAANINERLGHLTAASKEAAIETTRTLVNIALEELKKTELNTATHGGMCIVQSVWDILDSVLPKSH